MNFDKDFTHEIIEPLVDNPQFDQMDDQINNNFDDLSSYDKPQGSPELKLIAGAKCGETALQSEVVTDRIDNGRVKYTLPDDLVELKAKAMSNGSDDSEKAWNGYAVKLKKYVSQSLKEEDLEFASFLASDEQFYGHKNSREIRFMVDRAVRKKIDEAYEGNQLDQADQYIGLLTVPFNRDQQRKKFEDRIYTCLEDSVYIEDFQRANFLLSKIKQPENKIKAYKVWDKGVLKYLRKSYHYATKHPERFDEIKTKMIKYERVLKTDIAREEAHKLHDYYQKPLIRQSDDFLNNGSQAPRLYLA